MTDANPSRLGQVNAAGDSKALFLKVFGGEVLTAFGRESDFRDRHMMRTISHGKSAQFPVLGRASTQYHTPGAEILGENIKGAERVIVIDDQIVAPVFIANIDEAMNHYDVRGPYSTEIGEALAKGFDQNVARAMIQAARATAANSDLPDGGSTTNANYLTDGNVLWQGIFAAGVQLDENDVPMSERSAFMRPAQYALVVQSEKPIDNDLNPEGNGSIASGMVKRVNAIELVKSNNKVNADDSANTSVPTHLRGDYSNNAAIITHPSAAGTVELVGIATEMSYDPRRLGTLMVGRYAVGHGSLRSESAHELKTS